MSRTFIVATLAVLAAAGCGPAYYVDVEHDPIVAPLPPPEDLVEVPGPAPFSGARWTPGYWYWTGEGYEWVSGSWSRPPAAHFVWVPHGWVFVDSVYRYLPGRWAHPRRVPRYPYYRPPPRRPPPVHRSPGQRPPPIHRP